METLLSPELLALISINILVVISLWVPLYSGVISLGLAGFMVTGGLISGYLSREGAPFIMAIAAGTMGAAVLGLGPALLALRVKALYLAIATLAFAELTMVGVRNFEPLGGVQGLSGFALIDAYVLLGAGAAVVLLSVLFFRSRLGRLCEAVSHDPIAAASCGINVGKLQMSMTVIGAAVSGLAGALYAHYYGYVGPSSFGFETVVRGLIFLIVGGLTPAGAVLGATVFSLLPQYLGFLEGWMDAVYGAIVIVVLIFLPRGLLSKGSLGRRLFHRRAHRSRSDHVPKTSAGRLFARDSSKGGST